MDIINKYKDKLLIINNNYNKKKCNTIFNIINAKLIKESIIINKYKYNFIFKNQLLLLFFMIFKFITVNNM